MTKSGLFDLKRRISLLFNPRPKRRPEAMGPGIVTFTLHQRCHRGIGEGLALQSREQIIVGRQFPNRYHDSQRFISKRNAMLAPRLRALGRDKPNVSP